MFEQGATPRPPPFARMSAPVPLRSMNDATLQSLRRRIEAIDDPALNLGATIKPTIRSARSSTVRLPRAGEEVLGDLTLPAGVTTTLRHGDARQRGAGDISPRQPAGYDILGELGRGGIGIVYRARQQTLGREVALKRLQATDAPLRQAFLAESRVTGELEHPNIVPVYALCEEQPGDLWLVMKRIGGTTLAQLIRDARRAPDPQEIDRLLGVMLDVCDAARFAHSRGVLHRDIKPVNVMVGTFGEVMLLDWGIAARFTDDAAAAAEIPHVRDVDMIAGTPLYMPPEMAEARGEDCGPWTDVYLLGATLYEIITGRPPHHGNSLFDVISDATRGARLTFAADVPPELQQICRRALAHDPSSRYQDVDSLQRDLRDYLEHRQSRALAALADDGLTRWRNDAAAGIDEAKRPQMYRAISEVISSFQHACVLWPGNDAARAGEIVARRQWAEAALANGDLGVALTAIEGMTDPEATAVRVRVEAVSEDRRRTLRFARWLGAALIGAQFVLVVGLGVFAWLELRSFTRAEILEELRRLAPAAAAALEMVDEVNPASLDRVAEALDRESDFHVALVDVAGRVVADSESDAVTPPSAAPSWSEVAAVLAGAPEASSERVDERGREVLALARRWQHADGTDGVLVLTLPRETLDGSLHTILVSGLGALVVSFLIWSFVIRRVTRRLAVALSRVL
jgi:serine/threonine protein kinase